MEIKVSVIVPVYNAEKYLAACIESLLCQTLEECLFIFVNDGSTDSSGIILEKYKPLDDRMIVIHGENQGVSSARNEGLRHAVGEYVGFVDADDVVKHDMFETLYRSAKGDNCDVVISNFESEEQGRKNTTRYPFPIETVLGEDDIKEELLPYFITFDNLNTVVNKLYKLQVIRDHFLVFPKGVALGEDGLFNMRFFSNATRAKYVDYTGYYYREVAGSATRNMKGKDYFGRALEVYRMELPDSFRSRMDQGRLEELKATKLINSVMSLLHMYLTPSKEVSFGDRFTYVMGMIRHPVVREAIPIYCRVNYSTLGRYERVLVNMIQKRFIVGIVIATAYSRFRNR